LPLPEDRQQADVDLRTKVRGLAGEQLATAAAAQAGAFLRLVSECTGLLFVRKLVLEKFFA
jgi:hypothetical protein